MADTLGEAFVALRSDDARLQGDMETQLLKALGPVVAKGAKILGGLFLGKKVVGVARAGIAELAEAEKEVQLLGAQLTVTGGAAGVTESHILALAEANLKLVGTDDELTASSARVLLQFSRVTAAGGIYDETLRSAQDLAVVTGSELPQATRTLGLALQDPLKATRLLRSQNIALSASQQEQIQQFVATGNIMGAQRIILDQVASAVGGAGAAYGDTLAGDLQRAQEQLENTKASLLEGAAPALRLVADVSVEASEGIQALPGPLRTTASGMLGLGAAALSLGPTLLSLRTSTQSLAASKAILATTEATLVAQTPAVVASQRSVGAGFTAMLGPLALVVAGVALVEVAISSFGDDVGSIQDQLKGAIPTVQEFYDTFKGNAAELGPLNKQENEMVLKQARDLAQYSIPAARNYNEALRQRGFSTGEITAVIDREEAAQRGATAATRGQTLAEYDLTAAQDARLEAITGFASAQRAAEDALRGVRDAQQSVADAQRDLNEALAGASAEDLAQAELSLREALSGSRSATRTVAEEEAKLQQLRHGTSGTVEELVTQEQRLTDAREAANRAQRSLGELEREARINARRGITQTREQRFAIEDAAQASAAAAKTVADEEAKLRLLRSPASIAAVAEQERILEQARLAQERAAFAVTDAEERLQGLQLLGTEQDEAVIDSRRRVADAQLQVRDAYTAGADASAALANATDILSGKEETAISKARNLRTALANAVNLLAPGTPERRNLETQIVLLDRLLAQKTAVASTGGGSFAGGLFAGGFMEMLKKLGLIPGASGLATTVNRPTGFLFGEGSGPEDVLAVPHSKGGIQVGATSIAVSVGGVHFNGVVPTEAEAYRTGLAVGAGVADVLTRSGVRLAKRIA